MQFSTKKISLCEAFVLFLVRGGGSDYTLVLVICVFIKKIKSAHSFLLFCPPPVNNVAYPPVRWWWVHWSFYIQPQSCRCSRWSERWCRWAAQALLRLLLQGTRGYWEESGGRTGLDLQFEGGEWCRSVWGCVCETGLRVCPVLSPLLALLARRPLDPLNGDCCGSEVAAPSVLRWDRQTLEDNLTSKVRMQMIAITIIPFFFHLREYLEHRWSFAPAWKPISLRWLKFECIIIAHINVPVSILLNAYFSVCGYVYIWGCCNTRDYGLVSRSH